MDKVIASPIWYPGGKRWLFETVKAYMPDATSEIVSPFFGGGGIEVNLAVRGVKVHGYDNFETLVNFWDCFLKDARLVVAGAKAKARKHTRETLQKLTGDFDLIGGRWHRAFYYYLLNRLSFSGIIFQKWSSYVAPFEFNRDDDLVRIKKDKRQLAFPKTVDFWFERKIKATVNCLDFDESLAKHPDVFAYIDPPYPVVFPLYGKSKKQDINHDDLASILKTRCNWILSYNKHPLVENLYLDYKKVYFGVPNGIRNRKRMNEVLIFSHDIAERHKLG